MLYLSRLECNWSHTVFIFAQQCSQMIFNPLLPVGMQACIAPMQQNADTILHLVLVTMSYVQHVREDVQQYPCPMPDMHTLM